MKVTLFEFEHRGEGTYFSCYVPTKLNLNEFGNLASGDLLIDDCRMISRKQQKMIYALFADISEYSGHPVDFLKDFMKSKFIAEYGGEWFSLVTLICKRPRCLLILLSDLCLLRIFILVTERSHYLRKSRIIFITAL